MGVAVETGVGVGVAVEIGVGVGVAVETGVGVGVTVATGVGVGVGVEADVGVGVAVAVTVADGVGVVSDANTIEDLWDLNMPAKHKAIKVIIRAETVSCLDLFLSISHLQLSFMLRKH